jgi:F-type H+-transporting ATPase subunit epsilon
MPLNLEILTPEKTLFQGPIKSILVPGSKGSFMVLKNHAPIISTLEKGKLVISTESVKDQVFEIEGGVLEVKKNKIIVLVDVA